MKTITLEKMKVGMQWKVSAEVEQMYLQDMITYQITGYVWSQDAGKKVTFKYPSDWWEAVKERWLPKWLLKKYPVNYTYKEFEVKATYPDLIIQGHQPVMRLFESTYDDFSYKDIAR